jgi:hypothetical protein
MSLATIRSGLAANLADISGIRLYETIPDNPTIPCAILKLDRVQYDLDFKRGMTQYEFTILMVVTRVTEKRAQERLDAFIDAGARSVKTAVQSDRTLGGAAYDCIVTEMNSIDGVTIGSTEYLAAEFAVTVYAE